MRATLFFGRYRDVMSGDAWYILAALRTSRHTAPVVPPVADGPGVSADLSVRRRRAPTPIPHADTWGARNRAQISRAETKRSQTLSCALPWGNSPPSAMVSRRDPYNEHNTTRGGARFQCDLVIVVTSLHAVDPTVGIQTMMQIYASAARLRSSGAQSIDRHEGRGGTRATATSDRSWQIVASSASSAKS